ncbi:hypothetical protein F5876DRAFT_64863 [Lentinula aff. lateritia]|uniref:Uncharacterized protein n=1 Tax=Lentinula aff. lateritia TaxID=2804960 RepID=A0ACC1U2T6_9AGAR|nr:hypothetical protein F5876DRAFT_64863 [Lentinula aff. lateritia]
MSGMPRKLWWLVFKKMSPVDLASFSRCSKIFCELGTGFEQEMYTVERALGNFLLDVEMGDFQDLQAETGLLVGGPVGAWYISHGFEFEPSGIQFCSFANEFSRTVDVQHLQNGVIAISIDEDVRDYVHDNVLVAWTFKRGQSQMKMVKMHQTQGFSVQFKPSGRAVCDVKSALTFLYSRYLGDKHCYKIPLKYIGKRSPVNEYIEANTWSLAYTRKLNTCDYYPINVPDTRTEYIASTSFTSKVETQLIVLSRQIQSALIITEDINRSEATVLMVQELARRKRRRLADEASYMQLLSILSIAESADFPIDAAVAQDLFEYLDMLNDHFPSLNMYICVRLMRYLMPSGVLRILVKADFVDPVFNRMASAIHSIILNVHQDNGKYLLHTHPDIFVSFMTVAQLQACNSCLLTIQAEYDNGDYIPERLVKAIELCLPRPQDFYPSVYPSGPHIEALLIYQNNVNIGYQSCPREGLVVSFCLFSGGCRALTDIAYLVVCLAEGLLRDQETANLLGISYYTVADYCFGYMIFASISQRWYETAATTPFFEPWGGETDTYIATWPLFQDKFCTDAMIRTTIDDVNTLASL